MILKNEENDPISVLELSFWWHCEGWMTGEMVKGIVKAVGQVTAQIRLVAMI